MPLQGSSWVEHWLDRFCEPGTHDLVPLTESVMWCVSCGKKELNSGATCYFCDIPGSKPVVLRRNGAIIHLPIRLCVLCHEDLERNPGVRGYSVAS